MPASSIKHNRTQAPSTKHQIGDKPSIGNIHADTGRTSQSPHNVLPIRTKAQQEQAIAARQRATRNLQKFFSLNALRPEDIATPVALKNWLTINGGLTHFHQLLEGKEGFNIYVGKQQQTTGGQIKQNSKPVSNPTRQPNQEKINQEVAAYVNILLPILQKSSSEQAPTSQTTTQNNEPKTKNNISRAISVNSELLANAVKEIHNAVALDKLATAPVATETPSQSTAETPKIQEQPTPEAASEPANNEVTDSETNQKQAAISQNEPTSPVVNAAPETISSPTTVASSTPAPTIVIPEEKQRIETNPQEVVTEQQNIIITPDVQKPMEIKQIEKVPLNPAVPVLPIQRNEQKKETVTGRERKQPPFSRVAREFEKKQPPLVLPVITSAIKNQVAATNAMLNQTTPTEDKSIVKLTDVQKFQQAEALVRQLKTETNPGQQEKIRKQIQSIQSTVSPEYRQLVKKHLEKNPRDALLFRALLPMENTQMPPQIVQPHILPTTSTNAHSGKYVDKQTVLSFNPTQQVINTKNSNPSYFSSIQIMTGSNIVTEIELKLKCNPQYIHLQSVQVLNDSVYAIRLGDQPTQAANKNIPIKIPDHAEHEGILELKILLKKLSVTNFIDLLLLQFEVHSKDNLPTELTFEMAKGEAENVKGDVIAQTKNETFSFSATVLNAASTIINGKLFDGRTQGAAEHPLTQHNASQPIVKPTSIATAAIPTPAKPIQTLPSSAKTNPAQTARVTTTSSTSTSSSVTDIRAKITSQNQSVLRMINSKQPIIGKGIRPAPPVFSNQAPGKRMANASPLNNNWATGNAKLSMPLSNRISPELNDQPAYRGNGNDNTNLSEGYDDEPVMPAAGGGGNDVGSGQGPQGGSSISTQDGNPNNDDNKKRGLLDPLKRLNSIRSNISMWWWIGIGLVIMIVLMTVTNLNVDTANAGPDNGDTGTNTPPAQNVTLTKTVNGQDSNTVDPGTTLNYHIAVSVATTPVQEIIVTDVIPFAFSGKPQNISNPGSFDGNKTLTWDLKNPPQPGGSVDLSFSIVPSGAKGTVIYNIATATVTNTSGTTTTTGGDNTAPNTNTCAAMFDALNPSWTSGYQLPYNGENFGDPNCNFSGDALDTEIKNDDPANFQAWHDIAETESTAYEVRPWTGPNVFNGDSTSVKYYGGIGAFGLFQMNGIGHPADPCQPNTQYDNGEVEWHLQVQNATNYVKKYGDDKTFPLWGGEDGTSTGYGTYTCP